MGKRHKPPRRTYPLTQSLLYKCRSRKRLAGLLHFSNIDAMEQLANDGQESYRQFVTCEPGRKPRPVQQPLGHRQRVHLRLFSLFRRIRPPDYIHSGISGRSNISNARAHVGNHPLLNTDIKAFYPSTPGRLVRKFFTEQLRCSPDVAAVLTKICTVNDHVPTGSPLSQLLAFYAVKPLLDQIAKWCSERDVTFTVYVDDITISGQHATRRLLYHIKRLLAAEGYTCHKDAYYRASQPKIVTGVVVTATCVRVRNRQHQKIYQELYELLGQEPNKQLKAYATIKGRIASVSQIDPATAHHAGRLREWEQKL